MYEKTNFRCLTMQRYGKRGDCANTFNELAVFFNEKRRNRKKPDARHSLILRLDAYYTLISTSTPLGSSSFIRASTVLAVEL